MTRLDKATERLAQSLDRLELALRQRPRAPAPTAREIQILREDRARLAQELEGMRADYVALETLTDDVEARVDGTMRDLRRVLGA